MPNKLLHPSHMYIVCIVQIISLAILSKHPCRYEFTGVCGVCDVTSQAVTFVICSWGRGVPLPSAGEPMLWLFGIRPCQVSDGDRSVTVGCHSYAMLDSSWQRLCRREWIWLPLFPLSRYCAIYRMKPHPLALQICVCYWSDTRWTRFNRMVCYYCPWLGCGGQWSRSPYDLCLDKWRTGECVIGRLSYISFNCGPAAWMHYSIKFCS